MNTSMRADAQRNYKKLIEAAEVIFAKQGALAPLELIANKANVGIGTLYRHFPTRKDLLLAVYINRISYLVDQAQSLPQKVPPVAALTMWLQETIDYAVTYSGFNELIAMIADDKDAPLTKAANTLLGSAQKTGKLRNDIAVGEILQFIQGIADNATEVDRDKAKRMLSVVIDGLHAK